MMPSTESSQQFGSTGILKSQTFRKLLLAIASLVFTYFLIEFLALINALDYRGLFTNQFAWWPLNNVQDTELIHIRRPYVHFSGETRGGGITKGYRIPEPDKTLYHWDVKSDHNGFRNEADLTSAEIIVIGDSIVEGLTVSNEELMTSLLAQLQGKVVENLGQSAYGPQQELIVLKRYGLRLSPRIIIWMFSAETDLKDVVYYDRAMHQPPDFWHAFLSRSFTKTVLLPFFRSKASGLVRSGTIQTPNGGTVTMYFEASSKPLTKEDFSAIEATSNILAEAQKRSAAQDAKLVFVFVPEKFRVFHDFCQFPPASECRSWVVNDMPERLREALTSISPEIGFLDLTPTFLDAVKRGELPYYHDDDHWSPEGHRLAAGAINSYLLSMPRSGKASVR